MHKIITEIDEETHTLIDTYYDENGNIVGKVEASPDEQIITDPEPEVTINDVMAQILLNQAQIMVKIKEMEGTANE